MTQGRTSALLHIGSDGVTRIDPSIRLNPRTFIRCHTYKGTAPILGIDDEHVSVSLTVPDVENVTGQDVACARRLAEAVTAYVAELEQHAAAAAGAAHERDDAASEVA